MLWSITELNQNKKEQESKKLDQLVGGQNSKKKDVSYFQNNALNIEKQFSINTLPLATKKTSKY